MTPPRSTDLPTGTVTFLFTDIEGSTQLIQRHPDAIKSALARHHQLLHSVIELHHGRVFHVIGDGLFSAFANADDALGAALNAQRALQHQDWGELGEVRVRMGLHTGAAEARDGEYLSSLTLVRAQRVSAAGHGGQTLLSAAAAETVGARLPEGTTLRDLGAHKLRGLGDAEGIYQLVASDLPSEFPPLRVEDAGASSATPLHQLVRGRLIDRAAEALQLKQHWERAQQARGHLVLLSGEPGVGKTRLAQELISRAQESGATILRGGCYEYEATTPYLPMVEAFREWAQWRNADQLRAALGATATEIAKLAPEIEAKLGPLAPNAALSPGEERLRLFDNAARFLRSLAATRGLLLFVDDLHWADQGTLSLLHYVLRYLRNDRVLVLGAYRELELDRAHPLAAALVDWNRERLATRVMLGRLSREDSNALIATLFGQESVSEDFAAALYRETEGNPFFIEEVVKSLIEQGQIYREGEQWQRKEVHELAIPQSVKEAIGRRLTRLDDKVIETLRTAAAIGKSFAFGELASVAAADEDSLLDALDEASAAQLIRANIGSAGSAPRGDESFVFTHDKIREVLYEELNPIRRRRLHQRIAEALEKLYAGPATTGGEAAGTDQHAQDLAYHFTQAGDLERSLTWSRRAARNAVMVFAHDEALKFLEHARESAEVLHRPGEVAAIDEEIGDIHDARGVIPAAVESYERALAEATTRETRAALKVKVGNAYVPIGDPRGLARLEEALAELDPQTQTNALALATALVGRYYHYRTEHRKAIEFLERARQLAEPLDDPWTLCNIYSYLAGAHQHLLLFDESDRWARASIALGERKSFGFALALGNEFLAENAGGRGLWDETLVFADRDHEEAHKIGSIARAAWSGFCHGTGLYGKGDLSAAKNAALAALELAEQIGEERLATWIGPNAAAVAADLGDDEAAGQHAKRTWERAQRLQQLVLSAGALHALGYAAMQRGDLEAALEAYSQYVQLVRDTENGVARNLIMSSAAEAHLRAGKVDEAESLANKALEVAEFAKAPHYIALARRVLGQIHAARQRYDDAALAFGEAIAGFEKTASRLELGRALCYRASLRIDRGDANGARADASQARDLFAETGAMRDRERAEALLR
ncbi:MAG TPA: AAA family ATPase [Casimicrobiaceae bacterium]|nr:AAA family ATPase [Casimicrobiaceae bacterium]